MSDHLQDLLLCGREYEGLVVSPGPQERVLHAPDGQSNVLKGSFVMCSSG